MFLACTLLQFKHTASAVLHSRSSFNAFLPLAHAAVLLQILMNDEEEESVAYVHACCLIVLFPRRLRLFTGAYMAEKQTHAARLLAHLPQLCLLLTMPCYMPCHAMLFVAQKKPYHTTAQREERRPMFTSMFACLPALLTARRPACRLACPSSMLRSRGERDSSLCKPSPAGEAG